MPLAAPTPAQAVPGQFITGALWNANVYNGLTFLAAPPIAVLRQSVAQSLPNAAWTAINFDAEDVDSYGGHSTVTNTSRYTCQTAGWYTACGAVAYVPNSTGFRTVRLQINGAAINSAITYVPNNGTAEPVAITPTRDIFLNAGDYVEAAGYQNSGGSLNTQVSGPASGLWVRYSHA